MTTPGHDTLDEGRRRGARSSRWVAAPLAALACALMVACGDDADAPDGSVSRLEQTTSRGLAAEVLSHIDPESVDDVGGSDQGKDGRVASVWTQRSDVSGIFVEVGPPAPGQGWSCADEVGIVVECDEGPPYVKLIAHGLDDLRTPPGTEAGDGETVPVLEGWYVDQDRGSVMVLLYGTDTERSRRLARDLLDDRLLGTQTSAAMNRAGQDIAGFHDLTFENSVEWSAGDLSPTDAESASPQR